MNIFLAVLVNMLKANPQLLIALLEALAGHLKANPAAAQQVVDQLVEQVK